MPWPYTAAPVPLFVLDTSVYHMSPSFLPGVTPLSNSLLSGNLTLKDLWNAYLSIILSVPICDIGCLIMSLALLTCHYHIDLGFHCSLQLSL
jgi:hypothetical protein